MDWWARLGGDEWSLQGLAEEFHSDLRIWKDEDGRYYLSSPTLSASADDDAAWLEAELTLARINDAAILLDRGHRPIVAHALVRVGDDGTRSASVRLVAETGHYTLSGAHARARIVHADGTVAASGPSQLEKLYIALKKEGDQSDLAKAVRAWHSDKHDWGLLFHVYEIIKHEISGGTNDHNALQAAVPRGMTWPELDGELVRFRGTANDPTHAGAAARHGRPERNPISNPMSLIEAEDLIRRLLETWINTKI